MPRNDEISLRNMQKFQSAFRRKATLAVIRDTRRPMGKSSRTPVASASNVALMALLVLLAGCQDTTQREMVCTLSGRNATHTESSRHGAYYEPEPYDACPVTITLTGERLSADWRCAHSHHEQQLSKVIHASTPPGDIVALWSLGSSWPDAELWAVSFDRRELLIAQAQSGPFTVVKTSSFACH
jgi:hypothetical protein